MEIRDKTVAVTGATGFLGRYICDSLLRRGARVRGAVRDPHRVPSLATRGVEMRRCDLADRASLVAAFRGADAVVSNAALFAIGNTSWEAHRSTNVQGTLNVLQAAADAGVRRVVHVSSVAVYKGRILKGPLGEDHPQLSESDRSRTNAYAVSKALSEQAAWAAARDLGIDLTTTRPSTIYGAFDPNMTPRILRWVGRPVAPVPALAVLPLVYAGDAAEAVAAALAHDSSAGHAYNTAGDPLPFTAFVAALAAAGYPLTPLRIPVPFPIRIPVDNRRAARDLGFRNRPFVDALKEARALEAAERPPGRGGRAQV